MAPTKTRTLAAAVVMAALSIPASVAVRHATAQAGAPGQPAKEYYQRSLEIYEFRKAAKSGPDRGQEIFYYKCWFCHNEYTKDIPKLTGLFQRPTLLSGEHANDDTMTQKMRHCG